MKQIPLTQGFVALIDDADYESVSKHPWYAAKRGRRVYAVRYVPGRRPNGNAVTQNLHNFLLPEIERIDHEDGDGLNCRRKNLRPATRRQNGQGFRRKPVSASSQFRGVSWRKDSRWWSAHIRVEGKLVYLGHFQVEEAAARAYDKAARQYFGEFASPNFK